MGELISRQAAIDGTKKIPDLTVYAYCSFLDMLSNLPSVQERKGRWLRYGEDGYPNEKDTIAWQCDQCLTTYYGRTERIANYCPNCGAHMEGAEDDSQCRAVSI